MKAPATRTATSGKSAAAGTRPASVARAKGSAQPAVTGRGARAATKVAKSPATKAAARPSAASKAPAKAASTPVKSTAKSQTKAPVKAATKPAIGKAAPVSAQRPAARPAATAGKATPAAQGKVVKTAAAPAKPAKPAPMLPVVTIEPAARPLGKRAAKKAMMEQMTQAAVVPSHAPDAAKATFSSLNERPVMTTSVPSSLQKDPKRANNWKSLPVEQLTDQDILSMPDGEYMNDVQLAFFRRKLTQLKADMLANAGETTEHLREDTVVVPDPADRATIEEEHALELRTRDRERKLLKKIEQAIVRIDAGDYGYCDETGEPIGVGRLLARPTASLSLEAQQRRELKQKMFGD